MFPELKRAIKRFWADPEGPISLNLSTKSAADFSAAQAQWYWTNGYPMIATQLMGGLPAWSGETVGIDTALQNSTVFACNKLISECVGFTPAVLMQRKGNAKRKATEHPMYQAMLNQPNDEISAHGFTKLLTSHCLLVGGGFAKIIRRSGPNPTALQLVPLLPEQVDIAREKDGQKRIVYTVKEKGIPNKDYPLQIGKAQDILHIRGAGWDGIRGYSVITIGRQSLGTATASERNLAKFWASGGRTPYHVETTQKFQNDADAAAFRADLQQVAANPWNPPITEPWWKIVYPAGGASMRDAQGIENRMFTVSEICRWFNVSPPLVHDLSRATFNNIEQLFLYFKNLTLSSWYDTWEQDFRRCVLTPAEKEQDYFLRHDTRALLRSDITSRATAFASALQNGYKNIDEVRDEDDLDPLPDGKGEDYRVQLNMQTVGAPPVQPTPAPQKGLFTLTEPDISGTV